MAEEKPKEKRYAWISKTRLEAYLRKDIIYFSEYTGGQFKTSPQVEKACIWRLMDGREVVVCGISYDENIADIGFADKKMLGEADQWVRFATDEEVVQAFNNLE